jgi:hypothetical protein
MQLSDHVFLVEMWMRHDLDLNLDVYVVWRYWTIYSNDVDDQYVRMYVCYTQHMFLHRS